MPSRTGWRRIALVLLAIPLCAGQMCGLGVADLPGPMDDGTTEAPSTVRIRFVNASARYALDVQFYASAAGVGDPSAELFIPEKRIVGDIGFAGTGLIPAGQIDSTELACTNATTIGTLGGRFVDQDTGQQVATGQQRLYGLGAQYMCGDTITFRFYEAGASVGIQLVIE